MKNTDTSKDASALDSAKFTGIESPRQLRVILALLKGPRTREQIDRIAGASNGPEIVRQIRANGLGINCQMASHIDRDGKKGRHGVYHLPKSQRVKFQQWRTAMDLGGLL